MALGLVLALGVYGGLWLNSQRYSDAAKAIEVYIDGELQDVYDFDDEGTYRYDTDYGYNIISISNGQARIVEADCLTQSCIEDGAIEHVNETVVCLPHKFHIKVNGELAQEVEVDGISQ